jgi:hypothetical protein
MKKRVHNMTDTESWGEGEINGHAGCNVMTKSKDGGTLKLVSLD